MGVRKSVFGSAMEKSCFDKLKGTWGKNYDVYHNLPFLNVLTAKPGLMEGGGEPFTLSAEDYDFLKKTSIDFVVCGRRGKPIVGVDFDGMQDGFNVGTAYHLRSGSAGRAKRRAGIELKLRVAHGSHFPYLVLGSEEFRGLGNAVRLTIADGLIGEVISLQATQKRLGQGFDPRQCGLSSEEFDELSPEQQTEVMGDWVVGVEIESDFKHNPICREILRLSTELKVIGDGATFLNDGEHDRDKWVWLESSVESSLHGRASAKVCLPNSQTPFCSCTTHVAMEIGKLLALEKLRVRSRA